MPKTKSKKVPDKTPEKSSNQTIECKNCGRKFEGKYCPDCGQSIREFDKPFSFLIIDLAGNVFAFDTRFWKTLKNILIRPGYLTYDYLSGHRARYMPPFRFYIFISFIFFILLSFLVKKNMNYDDKIKTKIDSTLSENIHKQELDTIISFGRDTMQIDVEGVFPEGYFITDTSSEKELKIKMALKAINNNPTLYFNRFLKFISWSLFFLMPVYGVFLWLFFMKSRKYYYGHFVFSVNQHAFVFIFFIFLILLKLILPDRSNHPENYLLLIIPVYMIIATHQFYKSKWWKIVLKWITINFFYLFTLLLSVGFSFYFWFKSEFF
jgi:hypothetical protein